MPKAAATTDCLLQDERRHGVLILTLNRPDALNAFDDELSFALQDALKKAAKNPAVRCVVLTGAGRAFCAGQDLKSRSIATREDELPHLGESIRKRYSPLILALHQMEKPTIAMVNGVAAGAGASLAFACDLRVAVDSARFIQAFVGVGLIPDSGACWLLPRLIGLGRARELAMTGRPVLAEEALASGLVNRLSPADTLEADTLALADSLAAGPTRALGLMKRTFDRAMTTSLSDFLAYEADIQEIAGRTEDYREGVLAFTQKRSPAFTGR
ncbi:MAG: enoyl-CoA hydratase-related protein [Candidatus Melainabacteria bacterium]